MSLFNDLLMFSFLHNLTFLRRIYLCYISYMLYNLHHQVFLLAHTFPVTTRHRFDVHTTSITLKRRRMDVKTTSCAYWVITMEINTVCPLNILASIGIRGEKEN